MLWGAGDAEVAVVLPAKAIKVGCPVGVIYYEQIQPSIVVIVEPTGRNRPLVALDASLFGYVLKLAVAQVAIKNVPVDAGDKQIRVAIVVVICRRDAHRIARARHSGLQRYVGELHPAVIPVKPVEKSGRVLF